MSDGVVSGVGRNGNILILLTPIPSRLWLRLHKHSYDLAYNSNSDSFASENQPLWHNTVTRKLLN